MCSKINVLVVKVELMWGHMLQKEREWLQTKDWLVDHSHGAVLRRREFVLLTIISNIIIIVVVIVIIMQALQHHMYC